MNFKKKEVQSPLHYLVKHPKTESQQTPLLILLHGMEVMKKILTFYNHIN